MCTSAAAAADAMATRADAEMESAADAADTKADAAKATTASATADATNGFETKLI